MWMKEGINYLYAKFQINILKNKKVIKLLELWQLWLKTKKVKKYQNKDGKSSTVKYTTIILQYYKMNCGFC